jgi:5'-3' exonuclease
MLKGDENILFIDGSYFCYHQYHSTMKWWKIVYPDEKLVDPFSNRVFLEKFKKTFEFVISEIPKHFKFNSPPIIFVGKDCKRENIWRTQLYSEYKGKRVKNEHIGSFFKMVYDDDLFLKVGAKKILFHPNLEADDCIAISSLDLLEKYPNINITIVTSDKDYLQLTCSRLKIFNLAFKNIAENKSSLGDAKVELFCKIVMGDPSDNISSVLKKCGPKTAIKCFYDRVYFENRMKLENAYEKFDLNQRLVDFNKIPKDLRDEFLSSH